MESRIVVNIILASSTTSVASIYFIDFEIYVS